MQMSPSGSGYTRPLPLEADVFGSTKITGLIDKGPGKAALLLTEKHLSDDARGNLLAITRMTTFLRGYDGFGGINTSLPDPHVLPDGEPDTIVDLVTRPEQALFFRLNGDPNPLHADPAIAARAGFARPILHGLCTFGIICHALLKGLTSYEADHLRSMKLHFSFPVFPGETIWTEIRLGGSFCARVLERDVIVADNGFAQIDLQASPQNRKAMVGAEI